MDRKNLEYISACLEIAKDEFYYMESMEPSEPDSNATEREWEMYHMCYGHMPNKSLIRDNLRNVARMAFRLANVI